MEILYNFKPYAMPKKALFKSGGGEYLKCDETGLLIFSMPIEEAIVIGEADDSFVCKLIESKVCDTNNKNYGKPCLLPIGFHKSRLVKWIPVPGQQLSLFD